ncbi:MAG: SDR family NAD(P)-dependent oxidoreductase [Gemmatimonadetes bacterium]|nr:SDR family NAD(P)-dependent oxidoreductase [Gemmatimonadota bacterium]
MAGRGCLVTGANSGIGKAAAYGLAERGATVVMVCRNRERGEVAKADIERKGGEAVVRLAADPALDGITGRYFDKLEEARAARPAHDRELAERLWRVSAELTGLAG